MTLELLEGAVDALDAYLEAHMSGKVAELNIRYGDDHILEDIKKWYLGNMPSAMPETPSVAIHGADWRTGMQKPTNMQVTSLLNVLVFVGADDPEGRFRRLCRYALGIVELMNAGQTEMGYIVRLPAPVALTESMAPPEFLQGITIPVIMEKMETF